MISVLRRAALLMGVMAIAVAGSLSPASAATTNKEISGIETAVGCMSAKVCVAVGTDGSSHGTVVIVKNGKPGSVKKVHGVNRISGISCPTSKGCVAVASNSKDTGSVVVLFNASGGVKTTKALKTPAGVDVGPISCSSLKSCEFGGTDIFNTKFVVGSWNGKTTKVHEIASHGGSAPGIASISCSHGNCLAVGSMNHPVSTGVAILIKHGTPSKFFTIGFKNAQALTGVSCVSASTCYVVGDFTDPAGYVATVRNGKVAAHATFDSAPAGIACSGNKCLVAGEQISNTTPVAAGGFNGDLVPVSSGTPGAVDEVTASGGYAGVALKSSFFAATGAAAKSGSLHSEITTG
jgi:hypothetical protein